jgi:HEAT repeat protein
VPTSPSANERDHGNRVDELMNAGIKTRFARHYLTGRAFCFQSLLQVHVMSKEQLVALFDAERTTRNLHRALAGHPESQLFPVLREAALEASKLAADESALRLVRIASLLQGIAGPGPIDQLIDILSSSLPEARLAAGEALEGAAFERFKEVALGVERALKRLPDDSTALEELPYLLAQVGEPGCVRLLGSFLGLARAEVVASAIEALVELGDPSAIPMLRAIASDTRTVELEDDSEAVSLGVLAEEACEILEEAEEG